jgi:hypothetical protein
MDFTLSEFVLAIIGLSLMIFGACVLFNDKFLARMRKSLWKRTGEATFGMVFSEAESISFDRYGRGLGAFVAGIILLTMLFIKLFK